MSEANSFGRFMANAPCFFEIDKISSLSDETNIFDIKSDLFAQLIECSNNVLPLSNFIFLLGKPFEPPLAKMKAKFFIIIFPY